jgi:hypothetical protein
MLPTTIQNTTSRLPQGREDTSCVSALSNSWAAGHTHSNDISPRLHWYYVCPEALVLNLYDILKRGFLCLKTLHDSFICGHELGKCGHSKCAFLFEVIDDTWLTFCTCIENKEWLKCIKTTAQRRRSHPVCYIQDQSWWLRHYVPLKCYDTANMMHGATT